MRITDLLKKESISLNRELASKSDAIDALIELHEKAGNLSDKEAYKKEILAKRSTRLNCCRKRRCNSPC